MKNIIKQLKETGESTSLEVDGGTVEVTHLDKELWPSYPGGKAATKRDLLLYLAAVSPYMLPHLEDRPITLKRYPGGIGGEHFYQRHYEHELPPFMDAVELPDEESAKHQPYLVCNNLASLLWLGQMANIEFHTWFSRINPLPELPKNKDKEYLAGHPDFMIFDIDPYIYSGKEPEGAEPELHEAGFKKGCHAALWLKEVIEGLKFKTFVKTSGRTGIHVYVPIERKLDYTAVRAAAKTICQHVQKKHPSDITLEWSVEKRRGKVFLDFNQNVESKTLAAIYSPRPNPEASVSMPIKWEEIEKIYPTDFTIFNAPQRLEKTGDLWSGILDAKGDLASL